MSREAADQEGIDKSEFVQIMLICALRVKVVDESKILKFLMNQPYETQIQQLQSDGSNQNWEIRDEGHDGLSEKLDKFEKLRRTSCQV